MLSAAAADISAPVESGKKDGDSAESAVSMTSPLPKGSWMSALIDKGSLPSTALLTLVSCFSRAAASCSPEG